MADNLEKVPLVAAINNDEGEEEGEEKPTIGDLMSGFNYKLAKKWEKSLLEYKSSLNAETMKGEEARLLNEELKKM